jgi:hypothetical protein
MTEFLKSLFIRNITSNSEEYEEEYEKRMKQFFESSNINFNGITF